VYFFYSLMMALAALLLTPYWIIKGISQGKYLSNLSERLGFSYPALEKLPENAPGHLVARRLRWGNPIQCCTGEAVEGAVPGAAADCFNDHDHGPDNCARANAICGCGDLFPLDWGFLCEACAGCGEAGDRHCARNGDMAEFLARDPTKRRACRFCEREISDRSFARLSEMARADGILFAAFFAEHIGICFRVLDAK